MSSEEISFGNTRRKRKFLVNSSDEESNSDQENLATKKQRIQSKSPDVGIVDNSEPLFDDSDNEEVVASNNNEQENRLESSAKKNDDLTTNSRRSPLNDYFNIYQEDSDEENYDSSEDEGDSSLVDNLYAKYGLKKKVQPPKPAPVDPVQDFFRKPSKTPLTSVPNPKFNQTSPIASTSGNIPGFSTYASTSNVSRPLKRPLKIERVDGIKNEPDSDVKPSKIPKMPDIKLEDLMRGDDIERRRYGEFGMENEEDFQFRKSVTLATIKEIHDTIAERPDEEQVDDAPDFLTVPLKRHQLHALKFMRWREAEKVRGGIIADEMGLGKTLTTISLILRQKQIDEAKENVQKSTVKTEGERWSVQGDTEKYNGGTLVVAPAAVLMQWQREIENKVNGGVLSHNVFHGANRIKKATELARYDIVITSYQTVTSEHTKLMSRSCLFKVKFNRIILDEGHIIRNTKTGNCTAVCALRANCRWVLSGTPIQNKEDDLFALVKFLKCEPFDDRQYWTMFAGAKRKLESSPRVQTLLKAILLRRTKEELKDVEPLPSKTIELVRFELNNDERYIYNKMMAYSQRIFEQYLQQKKDRDADWAYDVKDFLTTFTSFAKKFKVNRKIKGHEILVLILRLRQTCCHVGLLREMMKNGGLRVDEDVGAWDSDDEDENLDSQKNQSQELKRLIFGNEDDDDNIWDINHPVFDTFETSSKIKKMMETLEQKVEGNKIVVVSQWTKYLGIIKTQLKEKKISYCEFNGTVAVKERNNIVELFNDPNSDVRVMLLSLTCGGIGINLVGANIMFIMDLHWNPQLEKQGQDRIHRFGQKKEVQIFKFICDDSIEERVLQLQEKKLAVAESTLTGAKMSNKLTLQDLKLLFGMAKS